MLKRSGYIHRYTPLKTRAKTALANVRKSMRRVSKKRAKVCREIDKDYLDQYRKDFPKCQVYGCRNDATDAHEILRGKYRIAARRVRACVLSTCRMCNLAMTDPAEYPLVLMLAYKLLADPDGYNLEDVLRVRNPRAMKAVEQWEVDAAAKGLKRKFQPEWARSEA